MVTNCFVSDGDYFYDSVGQICHNSPTEACDNPIYVDVINGNALLGKCGDFQVSDEMNLKPNEIGFFIENYEQGNTTKIWVIVLLIVLIGLTVLVIFRPKNLF